MLTNELRIIIGSIKPRVSFLIGEGRMLCAWGLKELIRIMRNTILLKFFNESSFYPFFKSYLFIEF